MCDTIVALGNSTKSNETIFAKNSDRPPNEAQIVEHYPQIEYDDQQLVKCTYIEIPQVRKVNAIFLSKPYWMWGAEMGVNEHGVAIGNEAVYSKEPVPESGLLGMDLLRLGLERGTTALKSLEVMTQLLEEHGQGGICEKDGVLTYHNSFLIADPTDAWVLETSGRLWVAQKVKDVRAISNGYTIHGEWDRGSNEIKEHAAEKGWWDEDSEFDFTKAYENETMRYIARCDDRLDCSRAFLEKNRGELDSSHVFQHMRCHPKAWTPSKQESAAICQHASHMNSFRTTGSQVSILGDNPTHWFTGSSNPCMSVYWPLTFNIPHVFPGMELGGEKYNEKSFWWYREPIRRELSLRFSETKDDVSEVIDRGQSSLFQIAEADFDRDGILSLADNLEDSLERILNRFETNITDDKEFIEFWDKRNEQAKIPNLTDN